jgi:hypothetical protein
MKHYKVTHETSYMQHKHATKETSLCNIDLVYETLPMQHMKHYLCHSYMKHETF